MVLLLAGRSGCLCDSGFSDELLSPSSLGTCQPVRHYQCLHRKQHVAVKRLGLPRTAGPAQASAEGNACVVPIVLELTVQEPVTEDSRRVRRKEGIKETGRKEKGRGLGVLSVKREPGP